MSRKYDWPAQLEAQAKSGLTQAEFCRRYDVCAKEASHDLRPFYPDILGLYFLLSLYLPLSATGLA